MRFLYKSEGRATCADYCISLIFCRARFDRVYVTTEQRKLLPTSIEILGKEPIGKAINRVTGQEYDLHLSDHFSLRVEFSIGEEGERA